MMRKINTLLIKILSIFNSITKQNVDLSLIVCIVLEAFTPISADLLKKVCSVFSPKRLYFNNDLLFPSINPKTQIELKYIKYVII